MNVSIIPIDGAVYVDGFSFSGLSFAVPEDVHALQWRSSKGWIEFIDSDEGFKPQNEAITELPAWAVAAVAKWQETKDELDNAVAAQASAQQSQPTVNDAQGAEIAALEGTQA